MRIAKEEGVKVQVRNHQEPIKMLETEENKNNGEPTNHNEKQDEGEHENGSFIQVEMISNEKS